MLELAVKAVWAAMPADVSLLHLLFYIHSGGKLDLLLDTEGGAQQDRFVEGAQNLAVKAAGRSPATGWCCGSPVRSIEYTAEDSVTVRADKAVVRARRAIVAIPPTLAGRIAYDPPLPGYRDQLTQRFPMGSCIKCLAFYEEPFWRAEGLSRQRRQRRRAPSRSSSTTLRRTARPGSSSDSSRATGRASSAGSERASAGPP